MSRTAALSRFSPIRAVVSAAARHPRGILWLGLAVVTVLGMMALLLIASLQAFVVMSRQSSDNTRGQLSLVLEQSPDAEAAAGLVDGVDGSSPDTGPDSDGTIALPTGTVGRDEVVSVEGIRVHRSIADDVAALLEAAAADGIDLSGWGWRDGATQIRLRRQHCGTTDYAIYQMPSSQCRPPTARPGRSQHERGLAIDFTYNGKSMSTRNNTGFRWLETNAPAYGLKNLPSEPWHWSTTGR